MIEDALPAIPSKNPLRTCLFHGNLGLYDFGSTIDQMNDGHRVNSPIGGSPSGFVMHLPHFKDA